MNFLPDLQDIPKRRKTLGLTQGQLSEKSGVSRSLIAKLETGENIPNYNNAKKIFDTLTQLEQNSGKSISGITVDRIHTTHIEYAEADQPALTAYRLMANKTYSQMPVRSHGKIIGSITEKTLNKKLLDMLPTEATSILVGEIMDDPFPSVPIKTPVNQVVHLLQNFQAILTVDKDKIAGIVTNTDLVKAFDNPFK